MTQTKWFGFDNGDGDWDWEEDEDEDINIELLGRVNGDIGRVLRGRGRVLLFQRLAGGGPLTLYNNRRVGILPVPDYTIVL